jgi:hypothetical protein
VTVQRWVIWAPGLAVAVGAAVATAHGLYEVAVAARVPAAIAWLYPLITDGLALVAYAATARLHGRAARYSWSVVVLAAGLSGLAQAAYLTAEPAAAGEPMVTAPAVLRFGIGAWPAVAAAIVAHLLYLLATDTPAAGADPEVAALSSTGRPSGDHAAGAGDGGAPDVPAEAFSASGVQPAVQPFTGPSVQSGSDGDVQSTRPAVRPVPAAAPVVRPDRRRSGASPARDRARAAAARHATHYGHLPTVSELEADAQVSRGTAAAALKHLRDHPSPLHLLITAAQRGDPDDDPTIEECLRP